MRPRQGRGRRLRRSTTFDSRTQAQVWIATQQAEHGQLTDPVTDQPLADYLRWWLAVEAPKGKPGRRPLRRSTLANYRVVIEDHLIPTLGDRKIGQLTVRELDSFAGRKLAGGYAPATVNRLRQTLRSSLATAVRQDRLIRNVARYGGGVAAELEPWHRRQQQREADGSDNVHGLVFTALNGRPIDQSNVSRVFHRSCTAAGVAHGSIKTFRSTVATQLADAGRHPSKTQAFPGTPTSPAP